MADVTEGAIRRSKRVARIAALATMLLGAIVLVGWTWHLEALRGRYPYPGAVKPATALLFLLTGLSLWLQVPEPVTPTRRRLALGLAALVMLGGVLYASEYLFGWDLGVDVLGARPDLVALQPAFPGRIAPHTALGFLLAGLALLLLDRRVAWRVSPHEALATLLAVVPYFTLLGYAYRIPQLYTVPPFVEIALYTAVGFCLVAIGLLMARPDRACMAHFHRDSAAGKMLRQLLPAALLVPPLIGWLRIQGELAGWYDKGIGITLMVTAMTLGALALILNSAREVEHAEANWRAAEAAGQAAAREIQDLYDHAPSGYHSLDRDGTFVQINDTELRWLGYTREELVNRRRFSDVLTPESRRRFTEGYPRFVAEGCVENLEFDLVRKDGGVMPIILSAVAVYDAEGHFVKSRSTLFDNTARKRAEQQLRESQAALEQAQRIAQLGNWEWDLATDTVICSDEVYRIYGLSPGAMGRKLQDFLDLHQSDRDRERVVRALNRALYEHEPYDLDLRIHRVDGTERTLHSQAEVEHDAAGLPVRMVGILQDITELRAAEAEIAKRTAELNQAKQLSALKDHFLSTISHEMRTPLSLIAGYAELLEDRYRGDELLPGLQDGVRRLTRHINNLVDYSALLSGSLRLYLTEVDLGELVLPLAHEANRRLKCRCRPLEVEIDPLTPHVMGDPHRLSQAICELLDNAVKFTAPRDRVGIRVMPAGARARVEVWDTGCGIPESEHSQIWEAFHQRAVGDTARRSGLGLGLAIVKQLVELHGGQVGLQSQEGQGCRFSLELPAYCADPGEPRSPSRSQGESAGS